jgi:hypothetical protein
MIAFNLERALAGEPVITRNGDEVYELVKFDSLKNYPIVGVIGNLLYRWTIDGKEFSHHSGKSSLDLFMKPKENALWVNVYKDNGTGELILGSSFKSEALARMVSTQLEHSEYIKTIKITE